MPRLRSKEELMRDVKIKQSWKGSGSKNDMLSMPPIIKPTHLDEWTRMKIQAPERAYKQFFISKQSPFSYTRSHARECGMPPEELLSPEFKLII